MTMIILDKMEELHLNQKALVERMNVTQQYVSKLLKGQENLSFETWAKIEIALEMKINIFARVR